MIVSKIATSAVLALALVGGTTAAQAAPAASALSLQNVQSLQDSAPRAKATAGKKQNLAGGVGVIVGILAAAAVVAGIIIAADNNNSPVSQ